MKTQHRHALGRALACFGLLAAPLFAGAIENAQQAFVTDAYEKNMRTMEMMNKLDANGDHMISKEEGEAYFSKLFDMLDRNHDGVLDHNEWVGAAEDKEVVSLSTGGYARALASMDMMVMVDTDGDHTVSKDEFIKAHEKLFNKMAGGQSVIDVQHWVSGHFPK
ncbi:MAG: EF-hand domain-containing protein [Dokdonella sp.]